MNIKRIRIADTEENRSSLFWKTHVGKNGVWTATSGDGLCDIAFDDPPIVVEGVQPNRFEVQPDMAARIRNDRQLAWERFLSRLEVTVIVFAAIGVVCLVYWFFR